MQALKISKLLLDANKDAYDIIWNAVNNFQEKAGEAMKSAFDSAPLPKEAKEAAAKTIEAYEIIVQQVMDTNKIGCENIMKTIAVSQEKAEKMTGQDFDRTLLQRYPHIILSL